MVKKALRNAATPASNPSQSRRTPTQDEMRRASEFFFDVQDPEDDFQRTIVDVYASFSMVRIPRLKDENLAIADGMARHAAFLGERVRSCDSRARPFVMQAIKDQIVNLEAFVRAISGP